MTDEFSAVTYAMAKKAGGGGEITPEALLENIEGNEYISVDLNETEDKVVVELDETNLETETPTEGSDKLITSGAVAEALADGLETKQDTLTAGENITIENNVISASGGGGDTFVVNLTKRKGADEYVSNVSQGEIRAAIINNKTILINARRRDSDSDSIDTLLFNPVSFNAYNYPIKIGSPLYLVNTNGELTNAVFTAKSTGTAETVFRFNEPSRSKNYLPGANLFTGTKQTSTALSYNTVYINSLEDRIAALEAKVAALEGN